MEAPCARCAADADGEAQSLGATLADAGCSPFERAVQEELHERVEAALREVPEAFRTVVVLREIEGFTYEEIAEILQVNLGTVKSRLTRGRAALRCLLAPECSTIATASGRSHSSSQLSAPEQSSEATANRLRTHAGSAARPGAGPYVEVAR